ncbi:hypothetical protein AHYW_002487 [Providencia manganoxydans]
MKEEWLTWLQCLVYKDKNWVGIPVNELQMFDFMFVSTGY